MRPAGPMDLRVPDVAEDFTVLRPMPILSVGGLSGALIAGPGVSGSDALAALGAGAAPPAPIPSHWRASASSIVPLASGVPIIPDANSGRPFVISRAPGADMVLSGGLVPPGAQPVCATIVYTSQGWIVINGALNADGTVTPGSSGLIVNGNSVATWAPIAANDVIQVPEAGNLLAGDSFVFVDPLETTRRVALPPGPELEMGEPWMRRRESDGNIVAFASFRGIIDKYPENQDRAFYRMSADGGVVAGIADGMGGHASGERSAEIGRHAFEDGVDSGMSLGDIVDAMNLDIFESNQARRERGGAVFAGVHLHTDGRIEARTVGDGEVVVMSLPADRSSGLRLDYWSTRPSFMQGHAYRLPTLPDGRVVLGYERTLRLDPDSNVVDTALGLHGQSMEGVQSADWINTEPGRIYLAIPMSDGLSEQYIDHAEMMGVVDAYIRRTGDVSPDGIRDALMRDALIRCSLARMAYREGRPFAITQSTFRRAYREMTLEMDGVATDPPSDLPIWPYQSHTGPNGAQEHYFMIPAGGTAFVVRGVTRPDGSVIPDPAVVSPTTGRLILSNPAATDHPSIVGRFKQDNISAAVVAFERTP